MKRVGVFELFLDVFRAEKHFKCAVIYLLVLPILTSINKIGNAQNRVIDSLSQHLSAPSDDTTKVRVLHRLSYELWYHDLQQSEIYAKEGIQLARKIDDGLGLAKLYNSLGVIYMLRGDTYNALKAYDESERIYIEVGHEKDISPVLNNKSIAYGNSGLYDESIKLLLQALKINEELNRKKDVLSNLVNLGVQYMHIDKDSSALEYFHRAKAMLDQGELERAEGQNDLYTINENIGSVYIELNTFDSARIYLEKALSIATNNGEKSRMASCNAHFANIAMKQNKFGEAIQFLEKGIKLYEESNSVLDANKLKISLGVALYNLKDFKQSIAIQTECYRKAIEMNWLPDASTASYNLAENYSAIRIYDSAYKYQSIHMKLNADLFNQAKEREIMSMQASYDLSKQQSQNELLQKRNSNQRLTLILLLVVTTFTMVGLYFFRRSYLREKKVRLLLDKKNEELTSVIRDLRRLQSQLIHNEKMASLGMLIAGVAHEINNPVNFISGGVQALEEDVKSLELRYKEKLVPEDRDLLSNMNELLMSIKNGVARTSDIISALKLFGSSDNRMVTFIQIGDCVESTLTILGSKLKDKVKLEKELLPTPSVQCNPSQINQVLLNVIDNAIQAVEDKGSQGKVFIRTYSLNGNVFISVRDNGPGIPSEIRQKIFDPFFTTKPVGKGTGLGLSISHNIIKDHNGSIDVKTEIGEGTEFIITLPVTNDLI